MRWRRKYPILGVWQTAEECFEEARELSRELQFYQSQFTKRDIIDGAREHIRRTEERYSLYNHHLVTRYEDRPFPIKLKPRMKWNGRRKYKEIVGFRDVSDDERSDREIDIDDQRVARGEAQKVHWRTAWKRERQQERAQNAQTEPHTKPQTQGEVWKELQKLQMLNGIGHVPKPKSKAPRHGQAPAAGGTYLTVAQGIMSKRALVHAVHAHLKNKPAPARKASPPAVKVPPAAQPRQILLGGYRKPSSPAKGAKGNHTLPKSFVPKKAKDDNSKIRHERMRMVRRANEAIHKTNIPKSSQDLAKPSQKVHPVKRAAKSTVNLFAPNPARKVKFESVQEESFAGPAAQSGTGPSTSREPLITEEDFFSDDSFDEPHGGVYMRGGQRDEHDPSGDLVDDDDSEWGAEFYSDDEDDVADTGISMRGGLGSDVDPAEQTVDDKSSRVEVEFHFDYEAEAGDDATTENVQPSSAPVTTDAGPPTGNPSPNTQNQSVGDGPERPVAPRGGPKVKWCTFAEAQTRRIAKENALPENATPLLPGIEKMRMHDGENGTYYETWGAGDCAAVTQKFPCWGCVDGRLRRLGPPPPGNGLTGIDNPEGLVRQAEKVLGRRLKKEEMFSNYRCPSVEDEAEQPVPPSEYPPHVVLERSNHQNDDQDGGENGDWSDAQDDGQDQDGAQESNGDQPSSDAPVPSDSDYEGDDKPSDWDSSTLTDPEDEDDDNEGEFGAPAPLILGTSHQFFSPLVRNPAFDANDTHVHHMASMDQRLQNLFVSPTADHALALNPSGPPMGITGDIAIQFFAREADADRKFQDAIRRNQSEAVVNARRRLISLYRMAADFLIGGDGNTHIGPRDLVPAEDAEDTSVAFEDNNDTSMHGGALDDDEEEYEEPDVSDSGVVFESDDEGDPFEVKMARFFAELENRSSDSNSDSDNEVELKFDDEDDENEPAAGVSGNTSMRGGAGDEHDDEWSSDSDEIESDNEVEFCSDDEDEPSSRASTDISMRGGAGGPDADEPSDSSNCDDSSNRDNEVEHHTDNDDEDQTGTFTANDQMMVSRALTINPGHHLYEQGEFHQSPDEPTFASMPHPCGRTDAEILQIIKDLNLKPEPKKKGPLDPLEQRIDDLIKQHAPSKTKVGAPQQLNAPPSATGANFGDENGDTAPEKLLSKPIDEELAGLLPILTGEDQDLGPATGTVFDRSRKGIKAPQGAELTEKFYRTAADEERRTELKAIYKSNKNAKKAKLAKVAEEEGPEHPLDSWAREMGLPPIRWSQNGKYSSGPSKKVDGSGFITVVGPNKMWTTAVDASDQPSKKEERRHFSFESEGPDEDSFIQRFPEDPAQVPTSAASFTQKFPEDPTEAPGCRKLSVGNSGQPLYKTLARDCSEIFGSMRFPGLATETRQKTQDAFKRVGRQPSVDISKIGYYNLAPSTVPSAAPSPALPRSATAESIEDELLRPAPALPQSATLNNIEDELLHPVGELRKGGLDDLIRESSSRSTSPKQPSRKVVHKLKPGFTKPKPYDIRPTFPVLEELSPGKRVHIYETSADFRPPLEDPKPPPKKVWYGFLIPGYRPKTSIKRDGWLKRLQNKLTGVQKLEPKTPTLLPTMKERVEAETAAKPLTLPGTAFVQLSDIERAPKKRISDYPRPGLTPARQTSFARHGKPVADPHCDIFVREKEGEIQLMPPPKTRLPSNILNATAGPPPKTALPPLPGTPGYGQFIELQDIKPPPKNKKVPKFENVDTPISATFRRLVFGRDEDTMIGPLSPAFTPNMELPPIAKRAAENPDLICMMVELYDGPTWDDEPLSPMRDESADTPEMPTPHNLAERNYAGDHNSGFQDAGPFRRHNQQLRDDEREQEFDYGVPADPDFNYGDPGPLRCLNGSQQEGVVEYDFVVEDRVKPQHEDDLYYAIPVEDRVRRRMSEALRQFQDAVVRQDQAAASNRQHSNASRQRADQPARARFRVRPGTPGPQPGDPLLQYEAPRERASSSIRSGIPFPRMDDDPRNEPRFQSIIHESASRRPQDPEPVRYERRSREARAAANRGYIHSLPAQPPADGESALQAAQRVYSLPQTPPRYGDLRSLPTQGLDTDVPSLMQRIANKVKRAVTCGRAGNSNGGEVEDVEMADMGVGGGVFGSPASGRRRRSDVSSNAGRQRSRRMTVAKANAKAGRDLKKAAEVQERVRGEAGVGRPWYEPAPTQSPAKRAAASVKSIFHRDN